MKKLIKIFLILVALVIVLLVVAAIALRIFLPPEKAKALVIQHLSAQLHRQVQVESVSVSIVSGLKMTKLRISENPTFAQGTFVSSEEFALNVALVPLLSKRIVIRSIFLKKPEVTVIRLADGKTFNFSDLTETAEPVHPDPKSATKPMPEAQPFVLLVSHAEIQKGALHFIDKSPAKQSVDIMPFDMKLQNVSLLKPFTMQMSTRVKYQGNDVGIAFGGEANLLSGAFNVTSGEISSGPMKISLHGTLSQLKSAQPAFKMHLESNAIPVQELLKLAQTPPPAGVTLGGTTLLSVDVSGNAAQQQFAAKWTGTGLQITRGEDFNKPAGTLLEASIIGDRSAEGLISLKTIGAKLSDNQITGSGAYDLSAKAPTVHLRLKGNKWSLEDAAKLSPSLASFKPTGELSFDVAMSGLASAPQTLVQTQGQMVLQQIKHQFYEGTPLSFQWNLTDITPELSRVSGTAALKQGRGKILQTTKLIASSILAKIVLGPLGPLAKLEEKGAFKQLIPPSFQTIVFDSLEGNYVLKSGDMDIRKFELLGQDLNVVNQGHIGLAGGPLNLNVALQLAKGSIRGTAGDILTDASGRPSFKFTVTGTLENHKVHVDTKEMQKKAVKEITNEILKDDKIKGAAEDLLKGIFR